MSIRHVIAGVACVLALVVLAAPITFAHFIVRYADMAPPYPGRPGNSCTTPPATTTAGRLIVAGLIFERHEITHPPCTAVEQIDVVLTRCRDGHPNCTMIKQRKLRGFRVASVNGQRIDDPDDNANYGNLDSIAQSFVSAGQDGVVFLVLGNGVHSERTVEIGFKAR